MKLVIVDII